MSLSSASQVTRVCNEGRRRRRYFAGRGGGTASTLAELLVIIGQTVCTRASSQLTRPPLSHGG